MAFRGFFQEWCSPLSVHLDRCTDRNLMIAPSSWWINWYGIDEAAQRIAHQPPQAHYTDCQNSYDLAREAVGCMGVLGGRIVVKACSK